MDIKDLVVMGLLALIAILAFAIWLETQRHRVAGEYGNQLLEVLIALKRAMVAGEPHQSMVLPVLAPPAVDPLAVQDPKLRRTVEVTRDEPLCPPAFDAVMPALGEDEDDTRILTRVGPPPVRPKGSR